MPYYPECPLQFRGARSLDSYLDAVHNGMSASTSLWMLNIGARWSLNHWDLDSVWELAKSYRDITNPRHVTSPRVRVLAFEVDRSGTRSPPRHDKWGRRKPTVEFREARLCRCAINPAP